MPLRAIDAAFRCFILRFRHCFRYIYFAADYAD